MGCYYTLCHNTYAYSLLFYKVYIKRENASSWDSGLEKEQILETYSAQLQKSWNFMEDVFQIYKKYWEQELHQGGHTLPMRVEGAPYPLGAPPTSWAPRVLSEPRFLARYVLWSVKIHYIISRRFWLLYHAIILCSCFKLSCCRLEQHVVPGFGRRKLCGWLPCRS